MSEDRFPSTPVPDREELIRRRQRGRAVIMAVLLGLLVALIFFVSIAKIKAGHK